MRVIAGSAKGRRLAVPAGARPTTGRVREAVFSMLGDVGGTHVLDVCAGSGAMAIEALSRGAESADLIDADSTAVGVCRKNLETVGFGDRARVQRGDARRLLAVPSTEREPADLVLCDPPYDWSNEEVSALLRTVEASPRRAPGARIVLERPTRSGTPTLPETWRSTRERIYGDTLVLIIDT